MDGYQLKSEGNTKQEDRSLQILGNLLDLDKIKVEHEGQVTVSIDGEIYFIDEENKPIIVSMNGIDSLATGKYQVKSTIDPDKKSLRLDIEDITNYVLRPPYRVIVFFVNIPSETVYWEIIDSKYVTSVLGVDLKKPKHKTKIINFRKEKIFDKSKTEVLLQDFINPSGDTLSPTRIPGKNSDQIATAEEVEKHKTSLNNLVTADLEKVLSLEALIFYNSPLVLTKTDLLQEVISKAELTVIEFDFYLKKLTGEGTITRVGDVISITDTRVAKSLLQELIDKKGIEYLYG